MRHLIKLVRPTGQGVDDAKPSNALERARNLLDNAGVKMLKNMIITNLQSCRKREKIQLQIHTGSWDKRTEALQQVVEKTKSISRQAGRQANKKEWREGGRKQGQ